MFFHFFSKKITRYIGLPLLVLAIIFVSYLYMNYYQSVKQVDAAVPMKVTMVTHYVCGQDTTVSKEDTLTINNIPQKYPGWIIEKVDQLTNEVKLKRNVAELAPDCKDAYFGLSPDGHLILYKGGTKKKQVIETFFQIDIESLETGLPEEPIQQLEEGIPVHDLAEFNSVLSTFSEFTRE